MEYKINTILPFYIVNATLLMMPALILKTGAKNTDGTIHMIILCVQYVLSNHAKKEDRSVGGGGWECTS